MHPAISFVSVASLQSAKTCLTVGTMAETSETIGEISPATSFTNFTTSGNKVSRSEIQLEVSVVSRAFGIQSVAVYLRTGTIASTSAIKEEISLFLMSVTNFSASEISFSTSEIQLAISPDPDSS